MNNPQILLDFAADGFVAQSRKYADSDLIFINNHRL